MKCEVHGTQQPRHINLLGGGASTVQQSNSLVQSIDQRSHKVVGEGWFTISIFQDGLLT